RPRLTRLLDDSTAQAIVITAPAGYGKTTLAKEWTQGKPNIAWYRASASSADVVALAVGIALSIQTLIPTAGRRLAQRVRIEGAPEIDGTALAELLAADLDRWPVDAWLVIDDYHILCRSTGSEDFVEELLSLAPVRLLTTSRRRPSWASARRILYGEVTEITRDDLAMTKQEASCVLAGHRSEVVRLLVREAAGWPAVIGLAGLTASTQTPQPRMSQTLFRYFADEVLRAQGPRLQRFMLTASVPTSLTVKLATDVLDCKNPSEFLARLKDEGFVSETELGRFVLHPLLRTCLNERLEAESPELRRQVIDRTLEFTRGHGFFEDAFELALETGETKVAAEIIGDAAPELFASGRLETVSSWLEACGSVSLLPNRALLARAELQIRQARLGDARMTALEVASRLSEGDPDVSRAWNIVGTASHLLSDERQALGAHLRAKRLAKAPSDSTQALWGAFLASSELERENSLGYLEAFAATSPENIDTQLRIWSGTVTWATRLGTFAGLAERGKALLPLVERTDDPLVKSSVLANLACIFTARGRYRQGLDFASRSVRLCQDLRLDFATAVCLGYRASAELGLRRFSDAAKTLDALRPLSLHSEDPYLRIAFEILQVRWVISYLRRPPHGDVKILREDDELFPKASYGEYLGLHALLAAAGGEVAHARELAQRCRHVTKGFEAAYLAEFAELVARMVETKSAPSLRRAAHALFRRAAEHEYLDAFVAAYRAYPPLLRLFADEPTVPAALVRIVTFANDESLGEQTGVLVPQVSFSVTHVGLTPR
ncbi:MAG: hypothetical protein LC808_30495, partial [Actinobacteria bacterium]|nr:hypothetical protein [Actinomycetota bacterium]